MKTLAPGQSKRNAVAGRGEKAVRAMNPDRKSESSCPLSRRPHHALGHDDFAAEIRGTLDPRGPVESLVVDQVVESAWRLQAAFDRKTVRVEVSEANPDKAPAVSQSRRASSSAADRALRSMREGGRNARHASHPPPVAHPRDHRAGPGPGLAPSPTRPRSRSTPSSTATPATGRSPPTKHPPTRSWPLGRGRSGRIGSSSTSKSPTSRPSSREPGSRSATSFR